MAWEGTFAEWIEPRIERVDGGYSCECWRWLRWLNPKGYAKYRVPQKFGFGSQSVRIHRLAYQEMVGPIPDGLDLDHLCRNTWCVNPAHLEPVTNSENARRTRRDHCGRGHLFDERNTRVTKDGSRVCRACFREYMREWSKRRRAA